jgi:hypothetical protein
LCRVAAFPSLDLARRGQFSAGNEDTPCSLWIDCPHTTWAIDLSIWSCFLLWLRQKILACNREGGQGGQDDMPALKAQFQTNNQACFIAKTWTRDSKVVTLSTSRSLCSFSVVGPCLSPPSPLRSVTFSGLARLVLSRYILILLPLDRSPTHHVGDRSIKWSCFLLWLGQKILAIVQEGGQGGSR